MIRGQIYAPATLPNYVHMHLMNRKFLLFETSYVCFHAKQLMPFISFWKNVLRSLFVQYLSAHSNMKSHSLCQALLLQEVYLWRLASLWIFLLCTPLITPPPALHRTPLREWYMKLFLKMFSQNSDSLYEYDRRIYSC